MVQIAKFNFGKVIACVCASILMEGCATLPKFGDEKLEDIRLSFHEKRCGPNCQNTEINKMFAACVLDWSEKSARSPGVADLAALATGLGFGTEFGAITAPLPIIVHATLLRPLTRVWDRDRHVYYCMAKHSRLLPSQEEIDCQKQKREKRSKHQTGNKTGIPLSEESCAP